MDHLPISMFGVVVVVVVGITLLYLLKKSLSYLPHHRTELVKLVKDSQSVEFHQGLFPADCTCLQE